MSGAYRWHAQGGPASLRRDGTGTPIVILPGVMADAETWRPVADALALPNPLVIVNRRGREPSPGLGADYGVPCEIGDLVSLVRSLDEPVHLFGWSYGGLVAIEAARALPLRTLIAYEPVSRPFAPEAIGPIRQALAGGDAGRPVEIVNLDVSGFAPPVVAALRAAPVWPDLCRLAAPLGEELAAIDCFAPSYAGYDRIEVPVTLLLGEINDGAEPYGTAFRRFTEAMPRASIEVMPGQGHLAHAEAPDILAGFIAAAIARAEAG